jgi:hypothetical protein
VLAAVAILLLAAGWHPGSARADGDPASDVLYGQNVFLPQDAGMSSEQQAQLGALLQAAQRSGYHLKVALIASPADLGSVTPLWQQPRNYALFLGQELSLVYRGALLVIMPNGFGLYGRGGPVAAEQSALGGLHPPGARGLGTAALTAIQRLGAASGYRLAIPSAAVASGSSAGSSDALSWIAFAIGGALILLAWTASLRARPVRLGRRRISSG